MIEWDGVMLDLETLGTKPGCVILSVGAVFFSSTAEEWKGPTFYSAVNRISCLHEGLKEDPDTVAWWRKQGESARAVLAEADLGTTPPLRSVLEGFALWLSKTVDQRKKLAVWGNGADFDNTILEAAYTAIGRKKPWGHYGSRCFRTLKALAPHVEKPVRAGTHHHALDDAIFQAEHAVRILQELRA